MKSNLNIIPYRTWSAIPRSWEARPNVINYDQLDPSEHIIDGWRDVVNPFIGENQRRGGLIYDESNDVFTYEVIDFTGEEIEARILSQAEGKREEIIQNKVKEDQIAFFQTLEPEDALANKEVYPVWSNELPFVEVPHKYLTVEENELVLWEVVQPHAPIDFAFRPSELPALWKRVALPDQILPWVQPLGSFDAYQTGDQVTRNGFTWESTVDNNIWEPGVFGWVQV
jgi:hypothetical protein